MRWNKRDKEYALNGGIKYAKSCYKKIEYCVQYRAEENEALRVNTESVIFSKIKTLEDCNYEMDKQRTRVG
ncbi:hypothetical protein AGMMS50276_30190 [Synergistales bacterium]|nr:hypothetical protein AGMMS50276_30190 [Synergistales bacterium]